MIEEYLNELEKIKNKIVELYSPSKIILFGSLAKKQIHDGSDIDLCIVIDTDDKRNLARKMQIEIDTYLAIDLIIYTNEEWEKYRDNKCHFAHIIFSEGEVIYGG